MTINTLFREWRDLWPGGLEEEEYSTLNLLSLCRSGELGYNYGECRKCRHREWYASSCGDRHCPTCLGPRQAHWSQQVCERLPDCPHFHLVFSLPAEVWEFFERNYRLAARLFFGAVSETVKTFQRNNWGCEGGFFAVLHTWGSALNWHPHLHLLVCAGGVKKDGSWMEARPDYAFPAKAMRKVFGAIFLRWLEEVDAVSGVDWPERLESLEARREWRVQLSGKSWNIFSKPTLGNTRAVVRYLARYTSRIAMSNRRIVAVDQAERTVRFRWKNYRKGGRVEEQSMGGASFLRAFARHLVPKGLRRIRYYGFLVGRGRRLEQAVNAPGRGIEEESIETKSPSCVSCGGSDWTYAALYMIRESASSTFSGPTSFSLLQARAGP